VLSDHEQRALEGIERCYAADAREPVTSGPASRRTARRTRRSSGVRRVVVVLGCVSVALLIAGVAAAALALAIATAIGWLFWRLWPHRTDGGSIAAPPMVGTGQGQSGSIRQYLTWLSEAE
jgi:ferric-dicitrate binding protein FerR (iron transport regulator)